MRAITVAIVLVGLAMALVLGLARGFDGRALAILGSMAAVGALAIAVAYRSQAGAMAPARCDECGGVISPNAPYCKHCGARRLDGRR